MPESDSLVKREESSKVWFFRRLRLLASPSCSIRLLVAFAICVLEATVVATAAEAGGDLSEGLLLRYARQINDSLASVYQTSTVKVESLDPSRRLNARASLKYWAEGRKYRYESRMFHAEGEADYDITFDGHIYSWLNVKQKVMMVSKVEPDSLMTSLNPLLLPADFLSKNSDACAGCLLKLKDFSDLAEVRQRIRLLSSQRIKDGIEITLDGNVINSNKFHWKVVFADTNSIIPLSLRKETLAGEVIDSISFPKVEAQIVAGKSTVWPRQAEYIGTEPDTKHPYKVLFNVTEMNFGLTIPPETFSPVTNAAETILDGDVSGHVIKKARKTIAKDGGRAWIAVLFLLTSLAFLAYILRIRRNNPAQGPVI